MLYNGGLDRLANLETAGHQWILLKGTGYLFDRAHRFVSDLDPATNEVTVAAYERVFPTGKTRTVNDTLARVEYYADAADFGDLETGESITALVLAETSGGDDTMPLIGFYNFASIDSADMSPFRIEFVDNLLAWTDEA